MSNKTPYLSGGRGRGQGSSKRTGYSVGNLLIDRKADNSKLKVESTRVVKPVHSTDGKEVIKKRKQQQLREVEDTRQINAHTEVNDDAPFDDELDLHQEQIVENVMKSYKEGSDDSKC